MPTLAVEAVANLARQRLEAGPAGEEGVATTDPRARQRGSICQVDPVGH